MIDFLNIYDRNLKKISVLQNAFDIYETQELNNIYNLRFSLPADDSKNEFCKPFYCVRWRDDGQLYRIIKKNTKDTDTGTITYECEHVIATLCDTILFGSYTYGGGTIKTADVIRWLLEKQNTINWELDECDFERRFEYGWEQENLLNAIFAIPKEFSSSYQWHFNTTVYPWKLSLKLIDVTKKPEFYIRAKRNLLQTDTTETDTDICTRLYPLGYGEGVNQLTIKDVNNGVPYLQAPQNLIEKYGIIEKVLVDRRFEIAESLKEYGQTMLEGLQSPSYKRTFGVVDLYPISSQNIDFAEVGKICRLTMDDTIVYITKTTRKLDEAGNLQIDLSNKATDVVSSIADLADRVRIESVYAQGATQLYQHSKDANATPDKGMVMSLYFPSEMRQINKVLLRLRLSRFRSYSQATEVAQSTVQSTTTLAASTPTTTILASTTPTTSSLAAISSTTSTLASTTPTTSSAASKVGSTSTSNKEFGTTATGSLIGNSSTSSVTISGDATTDTHFTDYNAYTSAVDGNGEHYHSLWLGGLDHYHTVNFNAGSHSHTFELPSHTHGLELPAHKHDVTIPAHTHTVTIPSHNHNVTIPSHSHSVTIPAHSHQVTIPAHDHQVTIPAHDHKITAGIFESGNPTKFDVYVNSKYKTTIYDTSYEGDITEWILNDRNQVPRGTWITVEFRPNDLAYVVSSVFVQGFVQSRGGGNY